MIDYRIDAERGLVEITIPVASPPTEVLKVLDQLADDSEVEGLDRMFVCLEGALGGHSTSEIRALATRIATLFAGHVHHTAIIASGDVDFGLARMFAARRERPAEMLSIFRSIDEGHTWLSEQRRDSQSARD
jgi:hypothetical protein